MQIGTRRAAALVLALLAIIVFTCSTMCVVGMSSSLLMQRTEAAWLIEADGLLSAAEPAINEWLVKRSSRVVLPSDALRPCVNILDDHWELEAQKCSIAIAAWDQRGMAPARMLQRGSPLR